MNKAYIYIVGIVMGNLYETIKSLSDWLGFIWLALIFGLLFGIIYEEGIKFAKTKKGEKKCQRRMKNEKRNI